MPKRFIYPSICDSETLERLSSEAENLFYRLIVQVDDFGRFDARIPKLRASCFSLRVDRISEGDVARWLDELADAGLVRVYHVDARPYLEFVTWAKWQEIRAKTSKWPEPPSLRAFADICEQMSADARSCEQMSPKTKTETKPETDPESNTKTDPDPETKTSPLVADETASVDSSASAAPHPSAIDLFDAALRDVPGYEPTPVFLETIAAHYQAKVDLALEASKMRAWLAKPKNQGRVCDAKFIADWLSRELTAKERGYGPADHAQERARSDSKARAGRSEASDGGKYDYLREFYER